MQTDLLTFLRSRIQCPGQIPTLPTGLLGFLLIFLHRSLVDHSAKEENVSTHRRLSSVDVTNEDDVEMRLDSSEHCRVAISFEQSDSHEECSQSSSFPYKSASVSSSAAASTSFFSVSPSFVFVASALAAAAAFVSFGATTPGAGAGVPGFEPTGVTTLLDPGVGALEAGAEAGFAPPILRAGAGDPPILNDIVGGLTGAGALGSIGARVKGTVERGTAALTGGT